MLIIVSLCSGQALRAQNIDRGLAFYFSNPLSIASKFRIKAEYRLGTQKSVLVSYTRYWGYFPGYAAGVEYRSYWETLSEHENFLYGKGGLGNVGYRNFFKDEAVFRVPGNFVFGGAGVGRHWNIKNFFIDASLGAKFTWVPSPEGDYNEVLFYLTGPGAVLDANIHIGFQL